MELIKKTELHKVVGGKLLPDAPAQSLEYQVEKPGFWDYLSDGILKLFGQENTKVKLWEEFNKLFK
ncbi:hypothetical protein PMPD1_0918 [Paramixta manurensis]|uniref:Uncharacterized protein n=1 Tax=Paramixta manurensis TaxID=2740817 RepID=A0A6M8UBR4_9GAMM|nr:hypothetical protein PMPD1_0918 [Erwiniaceae bacterium PD-1]